MLFGLNDNELKLKKTNKLKRHGKVGAILLERPAWALASKYLDTQSIGSGAVSPICRRHIQTRAPLEV